MEIFQVERKQRNEPVVQAFPEPKSLEELNAELKQSEERSLRASRALKRKMRQEAEHAERLLGSPHRKGRTSESGDAGDAGSETEFPRKYVGELQEKWDFHSDHLPVGATVNDVHVSTWNVLNKAYMSWIEENGQGISRSLITKENIEIDGTGLTLREKHIVEEIVQMIQTAPHKQSILSLQECGARFLEELQRSLPERMKIVHSSDPTQIDQNVVIYDAELFDYLPEQSRIVRDAYPKSSPGRPLMDLVFKKKEDQTHYRVVNAHVPGDPALPGAYEFALYLLSHPSPKDFVTIGMGDMNFEPDVMTRALERAASKVGGENPFEDVVGYYTHVGTDLSAKVIDHIFVAGANTATADTPDEVLPGLQKIVDLLDSGKK